jgi:hypothetical protein
MANGAFLAKFNISGSGWVGGQKKLAKTGKKLAK